MKKAFLVVGTVILVFGVVTAEELKCRDPGATQVLRELYAQLIPFPGTPTPYGIPISLWNVNRFLSWYNSIRLTPREEALLRGALAGLRVPPCGHASILDCCRGGGTAPEKVCGMVHSALGLAKWLVHVKHFSSNGLREAVDQWLHFIFSSYYLAEALAARGIDPGSCGLPMVGTCVRGQPGEQAGQGGCEVVGAADSRADGGG